MSKKIHCKVLGVDCRDQGQTKEEYNNQSACGFAGVTVTKIKGEVDCMLCKRAVGISGTLAMHKVGWKVK